MKNFTFPIICIVFAVLATGCARYNLKQKMKDFMQAMVVLTDGLHVVCDRAITSITEFDLANQKDLKLIVYNDSLSCSSCQINHMYDMLSLYEKSDTSAFDIYVIFSPRQEEYDAVMEELMILDFPYPVYVDFDGSFRRVNRDIPDDRRFHSFLIDVDGHPVYIGNPTANDELLALFDEIIEKHN